jgi:hypothetical protein
MAAEWQKRFGLSRDLLAAVLSVEKLGAEEYILLLYVL